jgi:saccharopine dehydrogenase (NAD+, L-lysine-forming)
VRLYNSDGEHVTMAVEVPNTYAFTAASMVHAAYRLPSRGVAGALAPSTALGVDFITTIPGMDLMYLDDG